MSQISIQRDLKADRETIARLSKSTWSAVWCPGGKFEHQSMNPPGAYMGCMVLETDTGFYELSGNSLEAAGVETFQLVVRKTADIGTRESERLFVPPRRRVMMFPGDIRVQRFLGSSEKNVFLVLGRLHFGVGRVIQGLLFKHKSSQLLYIVNNDLPESLLVTTTDALVSTLCSGLDEEEAT